MTFNRGETVQTLAVPVVGDTEVDSRETFVVNLTNAVNATIADGQGAATIVDEGYRLVGGDGGIFTFGERNFHGSTGNLRLNRPIVGGATDVSDDDGYWMVASDGGVFAFGAEFHGLLAAVTLSAPAVEIEPTPSGRGYWIVPADGKVYPFADARHFGDFAGRAINRPVIGMSVTRTGQGVLLVAEDGGIFNFGDAGFFGSTGR